MLKTTVYNLLGTIGPILHGAKEGATSAAAVATKANAGISQIITAGQLILGGLVALCILGIGMLFLVGGQKGAEKAKDWSKYVIVGTGCVMLAEVIAQWLKGVF